MKKALPQGMHDGMKKGFFSVLKASLFVSYVMSWNLSPVYFRQRIPQIFFIIITQFTNNVQLLHKYPTNTRTQFIAHTTNLISFVDRGSAVDFYSFLSVFVWMLSLLLTLWKKRDRVTGYKKNWSFLPSGSSGISGAYSISISSSGKLITSGGGWYWGGGVWYWGGRVWYWGGGGANDENFYFFNF